MRPLYCMTEAHNSKVQKAMKDPRVQDTVMSVDFPVSCPLYQKSRRHRRRWSSLRTSTLIDGCRARSEAEKGPDQPGNPEDCRDDTRADRTETSSDHQKSRRMRHAHVDVQGMVQTILMLAQTTDSPCTHQGSEKHSAGWHMNLVSDSLARDSFARRLSRREGVQFQGWSYLAITPSATRPHR